jgi:methylglyoxal synthase
MVRDEIDRLFSWKEHHRRLVTRVVLALGLTLVVDAAGSVLVWRFESGVRGGDIHDFGDAVFFTTVQVLTVSSQIRNPLTAAGRVVDVLLEVWGIFVVTAIAGSFAAFFGTSSD